MNNNALKTRQLKKALILALEKKLGNITSACKVVKCHRDTFYYHYNRDQKFKEQVDDLINVALDTVEDHLFRRIKRGDTTAIIFYLKTKGKGRGYIERQELDVRDVKIKVTKR